MTTTLTLKKLLDVRLMRKLEEEQAAQARRAVDAEIAALLKAELPAEKKGEGTVSSAVGGHKITVTYGVTRKVDSDALGSSWSQLPADAQGAFRWGADVSLAKFKALSGDAKKAAEAFVTSKESTPSVKVELAA